MDVLTANNEATIAFDVGLDYPSIKNVFTGAHQLISNHTYVQL